MDDRAAPHGRAGHELHVPPSARSARSARSAPSAPSAGATPSPASPSPRRSEGLLLYSAGVRLAGALVLAAGLWLAVLWAMT